MDTRDLCPIFAELELSQMKIGVSHFKISICFYTGQLWSEKQILAIYLPRSKFIQWYAAGGWWLAACGIQISYFPRFGLSLRSNNTHKNSTYIYFVYKLLWLYFSFNNLNHSNGNAVGCWMLNGFSLFWWISFIE